MELEQLTNLEQQMTTMGGNLLSVQDSIRTAENNLLSVESESGSDQNQISLLNEKSSINGELADYRTKMMEYDNTIQTLQMNLEQYQLKARQDGYISMNSEVSEGSFLGQGTVLCEIVPENSGDYYAEIYISNKDIGNIEEGKVKNDSKS